MPPSEASIARSSTVDDPKPLLAMRNVSLNFGGVRALDDVSIDVTAGRIIALIGPNGAGKSTLFNCLNRLYTPDAGSITFNGDDVLRLAPHEIAAIGIGRTFQNLALFGTMTVAENLMIGAHHWSTDRLGHAVFRTPRLRHTERAIFGRALEVIDYLGLREVGARLAGELPFPVQKRVELGRALMAEPTLLLLDEPAGGLNHAEVNELTALLRRLRADFDLTMILVEHRMSMVMALSDTVTVLDSGRVIAHGAPAQVQRDPRVIEAYLGHRVAAQAAERVS